MTEISYQGWQFQIELAISQDYYQSQPISVKGLKDYLPMLTSFFESLGIDIEKPVGKSENELCYDFFGKATSQEGYEIDFYGEGKFVSVVLYPGDNICGKMSLCLYGVRL